MSDVRPEQYTTVIREMIRHENDLTNHRLMWLLIGQGFIANAYVSGKQTGQFIALALFVAGIGLSVSAFLMLYKSYLARGYLECLGQRAKQGSLREDQLPLVGWPRRRLKDWSKEVWSAPWIARTSDLLEPWFLLPSLFVFMWMASVLKGTTTLDPAVLLAVGILLSAMIIALSVIITVWARAKDEVS
jgi:hypothetical protein